MHDLYVRWIGIYITCAILVVGGLLVDAHDRRAAQKDSRRRLKHSAS